MKRQLTIVFVTVGICNFVAMYGALVLLLSFYSAFDAVDPTASVACATLFVTGVLLCRAPFSKRRVDHDIVALIKLGLLVAFAIGFWSLLSCMLHDGVDSICTAVAVLSAINIYLILSMRAWRTRYRAHQAS